MVTALSIAAGCGPNAAHGGPGEQNADPPALVFAAVPSQRPATLQQSHQPIIEMLQKETGTRIRFQTGTDYAAVIEGLSTGKIDIAALGPFAYVRAKQLGAPISVVAARVDEKGSTPGYRAYGITWRGSPITGLADFRGKKVCYVDPDSTSGYLYPSAALLTAGIDPEKDTTPVFAKRHDAVVLAVANRQCDAGFALDRMV
ncbi:MAG TPA: phosphate/phosphite/phosphonate ABC transporter substrate-binding protein, partial [Pseudonocardiaceae bacterium]|nr:phosphate/phosphite/phosphonate ABC transporter substrate-binding protein [Pseudonocardiaceae bacterium]